MASGIGLRKDCMTYYEDLQKGKKYTWVTFKMVTNESSIEEFVVAEVSEVRESKKMPDEGNAEQYEEFVLMLSTLKDDDKGAACRFALFDFIAPKETGGRNKVMFIQWCPDEAKVKQKMVLSASKEAVLKKFTEVAIILQANCKDDLDVSNFRDKLRQN